MKANAAQRAALGRVSPRNVQITRCVVGPVPAPMSLGRTVIVRRASYADYLRVPPAERFVRDVEGVGREYFVADGSAK